VVVSVYFVPPKRDYPWISASWATKTH